MLTKLVALVENTKLGDPTTTLDVSFQFRAKVTWDNDLTEFYHFEHGDTKDLDSDEDYKLIPQDPDVALELKKLRKLAKTR